MLPRALRPAVSACVGTRASRRFGPRLVPPFERAVARVTGRRRREAVRAMLEANRPGQRGYERLSGRRIPLFGLLPR